MIRIGLPRSPRLDGGPRKVRIHRCSYHGAWYRNLVGYIVPIEFTDSEGHWAREGGEYNCINVIRHEDATLEPLEN